MKDYVFKLLQKCCCFKAKTGCGFSPGNSQLPLCVLEEKYQDIFLRFEKPLSQTRRRRDIIWKSILIVATKGTLLQGIDTRQTEKRKLESGYTRHRKPAGIAFFLSGVMMSCDAKQPF